MSVIIKNINYTDSFNTQSALLLTSISIHLGSIIHCTCKRTISALICNDKFKHWFKISTIKYRLFNIDKKLPQGLKMGQFKYYFDPFVVHVYWSDRCAAGILKTNAIFIYSKCIPIHIFHAGKRYLFIYFLSWNLVPIPAHIPITHLRQIATHTKFDRNHFMMSSILSENLTPDEEHLFFDQWILMSGSIKFKWVN